jgi:hypothetical protein
MWVLPSLCLLVIGREFVTWIMLALFMPFSVQIHLRIFLDQHLWNPLDNDPILMLSHYFYMYYAGIDTLKVVRNERQQAPPHLVFAHPRVKGRTKVEHHFLLI